MQIEQNDNEILIRIPSNTNIEGLQRLLDFIKFQEITSKSNADKSQINELSKSIKSDWWEANKEKFLSESST